MPTESRMRPRNVLVVLGVVGLVALSNSTPGRWAARLIGLGVETQNAYLAFGQREGSDDPADAPSPIEEAELALAAEALGAQPPRARRVHPPGTVLTLEYTTLGSRSEALERWPSRAIVPSLGDGGELDDEVWSVPVPDVEQALGEREGRVLRASGETGLPADWLLRTATGDAFEIDMPDLLETADAFGWRPRAVRRREYEIDGRPERSPLRVRVRVVAACTPRLEVAERIVLETSQFSILPVPLGFREERWVQMIGCRSAVDAAEPVSAAEKGSPTSPGTDAPRPLLHIARDGTVQVDEDGLQAGNRSVAIRIETLCRFDPERESWQVLHRAPRNGVPIPLPPLARSGHPVEPRVLARLPGVALYWMRWSEVAAPPTDDPSQDHHGFGWVGGMLCNDVDLAPAPPGRVATCVPYSDHAIATYVPDPLEACRPVRETTGEAGSEAVGAG